MFENKEIKINISDFQKVFAVTAVMLQTILSFALANTHNETTAACIGTLYVMVKYTAPLFIFAIVYTNQVLFDLILLVVQFLLLRLSCRNRQIF